MVSLCIPFCRACLLSLGRKTSFPSSKFFGLLFIRVFVLKHFSPRLFLRKNIHNNTAMLASRRLCTRGPRWFRLYSSSGLLSCFMFHFTGFTNTNWALFEILLRCRRSQLFSFFSTFLSFPFLLVCFDFEATGRSKRLCLPLRREQEKMFFFLVVSRSALVFATYFCSKEGRLEARRDTKST